MPVDLVDSGPGETSDERRAGRSSHHAITADRDLGESAAGQA